MTALLANYKCVHILVQPNDDSFFCFSAREIIMCVFYIALEAISQRSKPHLGTDIHVFPLLQEGALIFVSSVI